LSEFEKGKEIEEEKKGKKKTDSAQPAHPFSLSPKPSSPFALKPSKPHGPASFFPSPVRPDPLLRRGVTRTPLYLADSSGPARQCRPAPRARTAHSPVGRLTALARVSACIRPRLRVARSPCALADSPVPRASAPLPFFFPATTGLCSTPPCSAPLGPPLCCGPPWLLQAHRSAPPHPPHLEAMLRARDHAERLA